MSVGRAEFITYFIISIQPLG